MKPTILILALCLAGCDKPHLSIWCEKYGIKEPCCVDGGWNEDNNARPAIMRDGVISCDWGKRMKKLLLMVLVLLMGCDGVHAVRTVCENKDTGTTCTTFYCEGVEPSSCNWK